ncbi:MAG: hypothetical protein WCG91_01740 [Candidatus Shapirobacteria bacterium]
MNIFCKPIQQYERPFCNSVCFISMRQEPSCYKLMCEISSIEEGQEIIAIFEQGAIIASKPGPGGELVLKIAVSVENSCLNYLTKLIIENDNYINKQIIEQCRKEFKV